MLSYKHLKVTAAAVALPITIAACGGGSTTGAASHNSTSAASTGTSSSPSPTSSSTAPLPTAVALGKNLEEGYKPQSSAHIVMVKPDGPNSVVDRVEIEGRMDDSLRSAKISSSTAGNHEERRVGSTRYLKGDQKYWSAAKISAETAKRLAGKWFIVPLEAQKASAKEPSLQAFLSEMFGPGADNDYTKMKVGRRSLNGQQVYSLSNSRGSELWVSTTEPTLPLQILRPTSPDPAVTISDWGKPVSITAPPGAVKLSADVVRGS